MGKRINSKQKGKGGELEIAKILQENGYPNARRGQQYCGANGDADVVGGPPGYHLEVKRTEHLSLYEAMQQAEADAAATNSTPVVLHRRNNKPWLMIMRLEDGLPLLNRPKM